MARKIQPRSNVPKPKRGQSSEDYWRERESRQRAENIRNEAKTAERINRIFQSMQDSIQQEIEAFYQRYASKEGITLTEARGRVSRIDMEQYERLAKKYVEAAHHGDEDLAFSQEANDQMRLYNAAMRINRLEMLKARCGIRAMEGYRDTERLINENLEERAYSEYRRLAGILGNSVQFNENMVRAIVNASYQNATWSQRLWNHQASLSSQIGTQLASGILAGKSSTVLAREIQKLTGGSTYVCQRLMRTELRRVQTEAAMQSMTDNGVTEYKFMVENGVNPCDECLALDGQVFKLSEMAPGKNAPPVHPSCHCASAPHVDEAKWQRWLDGPAQAGVPWGEFEEKGNSSKHYDVPDITGLGNNIKEKNIGNALSKSLDSVVNRLNQSDEKTQHKSLLSSIISTSEYRYIPGERIPLSYNREDDVFYFGAFIAEYLDADESYVITHDASHRLDSLFFRSWSNKSFLDALERCAEKAYPRKAEIEKWFEEGGKYYNNYAIGDAFDALFYGKIQTNVQRLDKDYYYEDSTRLPAEIFADLSSMLSTDGCDEPLFKEIADVIRKELN